MLKRVLVTGAGGFVGCNLVLRLLRDGHKVHALARSANWRTREFSDHAQMHAVDITDAQAVSRAVGELRPEWVFHLAAYGAYSTQNAVPRMVSANIVGTMNLVEACLRSGVEALVNAGSSSEYGYKDHPPAETEVLEPNSHYAVTKAAATMYCRFTAYERRISLPTLRLYSVYGPFEEPSRLIPTLIMLGFQGKLPPLVDPDIARDFVYTEDVCDAFVLAASTMTREFGAIYNVGTGTQMTLRDVVAAAKRQFRILVEPQWSSMPNRRWDTSAWVADHRKIAQSLGWQPRTTFAEGLRLTAEWLAGRPDLQAMYDHY